MKRLILALTLVLITATISAQKIKVDKKKGTMEMDKTLAAKFEETKDENKNTVYTFTNLNDNNSISFTELRLDAETYFKVSSSFNDKVSEIDYEMIVFSLSNRSIVANLAVKKHHLMDANGLKIDSINIFLNTPIETRVEKVARLEAEKQAALDARNEIIAVYAPVIKNNLIINGNTGVQMGRFDIPNNFKTPTNRIPLLVRNEQDTAIASIKDPLNIETHEYIISTYNKKPLIIKEAIGEELKMAMVEELILNHFFGEEENAYSVWMPKMLYIQKEYSPENTARTHVDGMLTLKDGTKVEGKFEVLFRQSEAGRVRKSNNLMLDGDGGNNKAVHMYVDEKGKNKLKAYKPKEIAEFEVVSDGETIEKYVYLTYELAHKKVVAQETSIVSSDGALDVGKLGMSLLKKSKGPKAKKKATDFVMIVKETPAITLYLLDGAYIVLKNGSELGAQINPLDINPSVLEIAEDCPTVTKKAENEEYEAETFEEDILKDYNNCN